LEYGSLLGAVHEDDPGTNVGEFGLAKLTILNALRESDLPYRWFRPFYLVGSSQHANSLFNSAFESCSKGLDFKPRSDPSVAFDFLDISDFAKGVSLALNNNSVWEVINLGSGSIYSIDEVANEFRRHFGIDQRVSSRQNSMFASIAKLSRATGWKPQLNLSEMVEKFIRDKDGVSN
jgi:nucleoside-diphosphate-sugar epimerase